MSRNIKSPNRAVIYFPFIEAQIVWPLRRAGTCLDLISLQLTLPWLSLLPFATRHSGSLVLFDLEHSNPVVLRVILCILPGLERMRQPSNNPSWMVRPPPFILQYEVQGLPAGYLAFLSWFFDMYSVLRIIGHPVPEREGEKEKKKKENRNSNNLGRMVYRLTIIAPNTLTPMSVDLWSSLYPLFDPKRGCGLRGCSSTTTHRTYVLCTRGLSRREGGMEERRGNVAFDNFKFFQSVRSKGRLIFGIRGRHREELMAC